MNLVIEDLGLVPYRRAYDRQVELVDKLHRNPDRDDICLVLEHPAVFTLGRNGSSTHIGVNKEFLAGKGVEIIRIERGGEVTYHGPGQLVCYPIINLRRRALNVAEFVRLLEQVMLETSASLGVQAFRDTRNHGIWTKQGKLGSVGIAIRHGITFHGLALNVNLDLEPFSWINPCGLSGVSMTSMEQELRSSLEFSEVKHTIIRELGRIFKKNAVSGGERQPKPKWLKKRLPSGVGYEKTRRLVSSGGLHTVCQEARCPNQFECYGKGTATFMILGESCTRNCRFCAVAHRGVKPPDPEEPARVGAAVQDMKLDYAVLTSVTRDDLPDGGAGHFIKTIEAIRKASPKTLVEILIPDLQGNSEALRLICQHKPAVLNHNIETVPRLYPLVRPQADYQRSLDLLSRVKAYDNDIITKSGLMVGLGETFDELKSTISDIRSSGCDLLTLGQYLQPTRDHLPVQRFIPPEEFEEIRHIALNLGFKAVAAGPHVRSSYRAGHLFRMAAETTSA